MTNSASSSSRPSGQVVVLVGEPGPVEADDRVEPRVLTGGEQADVH